MPCRLGIPRVASTRGDASTFPGARGFFAQARPPFTLRFSSPVRYLQLPDSTRFLGRSVVYRAYSGKDNLCRDEVLMANFQHD